MFNKKKTNTRYLRKNEHFRIWCLSKRFKFKYMYGSTMRARAFWINIFMCLGKHLALQILDYITYITTLITYSSSAKWQQFDLFSLLFYCFWNWRNGIFRRIHCYSLRFSFASCVLFVGKYLIVIYIRMTRGNVIFSEKNLFME